MARWLKAATASRNRVGTYRSRELQSREQEGEPEAATGEIRPQPQSDLDYVPLVLEHEKSYEVVHVAYDGEVAALALGRVEELGEVLRVGYRVVEVVGRVVPPSGDCARLPLGH